MNIKQIFYTLAISALLLQPRAFAANEEATFADIPWLSSKASVKKIAEEKKYVFRSDEGIGIAYESVVSGWPAQIIFYFSPEDKLVKSLVNIITGEDRFMKIYEDNKNSLTKKYGNPTLSIRDFKPPYTDGDGKEAQAVKAGKATIFTAWKKLGLLLQIKGDSTVSISYESPYWEKELERIKAKATNK